MPIYLGVRNMASRLIVGCGYVGMRVASKWLKQGDSVFAITRSNARANELSQCGINPIVWDWLVGGIPNVNASIGTFPELKASKFATILIAVTHSEQHGLPPVETHTRGLNHLASLLKTMGWWDSGQTQSKWVYLSTTGVFGPSPPGDWLDEDSDVLPDRPGSIAALAGEHWISSHISKDMRVNLRSAGIYGPDRVPRWQSIRDKTPLRVDPDSYLNLIHVDDLAAIVVAVSSANMQFALYCVSDGVPVRRREYYEYISKLGNWPQPVFESCSLRATGRSSFRSDGNKRVRNNRIKAELSIRLKYPSYREGMKSLLDETTNKPSI